ncbi:Hypp2825 [Branchiostoma lanceolatum]|uniref:Hypp2825 protein n=1 Tax=Branchiostoma lanceolatum TaxID=7740 RepID=A0A8J9ZUV7_BRALA|nr:Hypp2825 [Branchiostoma lanceolatum]
MKQVPLVIAIKSSERGIDDGEIICRVIQLLPKPRVKEAVLDFENESETPFTPAGLVSSYMDVSSTGHKQCCVVRKTTLDSIGFHRRRRHQLIHPLTPCTAVLVNRHIVPMFPRLQRKASTPGVDGLRGPHLDCQPPPISIELVRLLANDQDHYEAANDDMADKEQEEVESAEQIQENDDPYNLLALKDRQDGSCRMRVLADRMTLESSSTEGFSCGPNKGDENLVWRLSSVEYDYEWLSLRRTDVDQARPTIYRCHNGIGDAGYIRQFKREAMVSLASHTTLVCFLDDPKSLESCMKSVDFYEMGAILTLLRGFEAARVKVTCYKGLVRPHFEYSAIVWDPYTTKRDTDGGGRLAQGCPCDPE